MAATDIERLIVQLEASTTKLDNALVGVSAKVDNKLSEIERRTKVMSDKVEGAFSKVGEVILGFISAKALVEFTKNVAESAEKLEALSLRTGTSAEKLQQLAYAGRQAGVDTNQLNDALDIFGRNLGKAAAGQGDLAKVMQQFGIRGGKDMIDTFFKVADAVKNAASREEEFRIVTVAFGRGSIELVTFLRQGSAAIKEQADAYKGIDNATVERLAKLNKEWNELAIAFRNMGAYGALGLIDGFRLLIRDLNQGTWEQKLQALASYFSGGFLARPPALTGNEQVTELNQQILDKVHRLNEARQSLLRAAASGISNDRLDPGRQVIAQMEQEIRALQDARDKLLGTVTHAEQEATKPFSTQKEFTALEQFIGKMQLALELAGETADERARDEKLIAAAEAKLSQSGQAAYTLLNSMKAVRKELGDTVDEVNALSYGLEATALKVAISERKKTAAGDHFAGIPEDQLIAGTRKRNLEAIDNSYKQIAVTTKLTGLHDQLLEELNAEVDLAGMLPKEREEELTLLRIKQKFGTDFVNANEAEIRGMVQKRIETEKLTQLNEQVINDLSDIGAAALTGSENVKEAFSKMLLSIAQYIIKLEIANALEASLGKGGSLSGGGGDIFSGLLSLVGLGHAAGGGPISGPTVVGEHGPELLFPSGPGYVVPNFALGGGLGGRSSSTVHLVVEASPYFDARVKSTSDRSASIAIQSYDRSVLPSRVARIQRDPRMLG